MALLVCAGLGLAPSAGRAAPGGGPPGAGGGTEGEIRGRVVDRTAPAHPLAGQSVRLTIVERAASAERSAVTGGRGQFAFRGLPVGGIRVFIVSTEYRGVRYESDRIALTPGAPARSLELRVYEPGGTTAGLRATLVFAVVEIARGGLRVSEIQQFDNRTDRAIVPTAQDPLVFALPPGATGIEFLGGWRAPQVAPGRITDQIPVVPGSLRVAYAFRLDARTRDLTIPWDLPYGAAQVEVLVQDVGVRVRGDGLHPAPPVAGPRGRFLRWSGEHVPPGGEVAVHLAGVPTAGRPWPVLAAAVLAAALGAGLAWALRRPAPARAGGGGGTA